MPDCGLPLPCESTVASEGEAFRITNSGGGAAIAAVATGPTAVALTAQSDEAAAMTASSSTGSGVVASATAGRACAP